MNEITIDKYNFKINESGSGENVVFVHGSVSDLRTWMLNQQELSKHFHTFAYSRRYHWSNKQIEAGQDYSMLQHMKDLKYLIIDKKLNPVHLVGHSYGAFICLLLLQNEPEIIKSLVLAEPPAITLFVSFPPKPAELLKLLFTNPVTALLTIKFGAFGITPVEKEIKNDQYDKAIEIFGYAALGPKYFNQLSKERLEQVRQNLIKTEFLGSGFPKLDINKLKQSNIPTLLVTGEDSLRLFDIIVNKLMNTLPGSEWVKIPQASHIVHEDNPEYFNNAVISFLKDHQ